MNHLASGYLLAVALLVVGCGKTMTEADCRQVADHMREVWNAEAKKSVPSDPAAAQNAAEIIRSDGQKLVDDWASECKKELEGRRVDPKEMDCLLKAPTVEAINKCAEL